jgi:serine/threonine-protein kinase
MPPQVGQVINNKYRLLRHIGDGGMGSVFEARHEALGTTVALKFLHLEFSRREGLVQRFLQEARASAQIQSPHVVRVSDVDQTSTGDVFIVLEYLEGKTLQALYEELYKAGRRLAYAEALDYATQMIDGIEAAHAAGIIHRDLKPDNVMITVSPSGVTTLKLLDFGIAKLKGIGGKPGLTRPGVMMGTPEYMAPEQTSSADTVDARADVFSLGVMIFEMLAGQRPTGGEDPHEIAAAYVSGRISQLGDLAPGTAPELVAAVHRAMAARPMDRFVSASELREAIEPFAAAVRPPSPSRIRAGGTIGVSIAAAPAPGAPAPGPMPAIPAPVPSGRAGVAKTWPPDDEGPPAVVSGAPGKAVAGTMSDTPSVPSAKRGSGTFAGMPAGIDAGSTHPMPLPFGVPAPLPPVGRRRGGRRGASIGGILAAALAVAGLVTGGVYLATRSSSSGDDDPPKASHDPPTPTTPPQPQPVPPPTQVAPPPVPVPVPVPPPTTPRPSTPAPKPSGSAAPSAQPPQPFIIPSAFPFPNPFAPAPAPAPSGSSKPQQDAPLF